MSNSEEIKPVAIAIIEIRLSEGNSWNQDTVCWF